jgi:hypothetical protein
LTGESMPIAPLVGVLLCIIALAMNRRGKRTGR